MSDDVPFLLGGIRHTGRSFRVVWSEEDREYVGLCNQYPGLCWLGADEPAALNGIKALVAAVDRVIRGNTPSPAPAELDWRVEYLRNAIHAALTCLRNGNAEEATRMLLAAMGDTAPA